MRDRFTIPSCGRHGISCLVGPSVGRADQQEKLIKLNTLWANLVIFHNALDIADVVRTLVAEGWTITAEDLAGLSPYLRAHIRRFGAYATDELGIEPEAFEAALAEIDFTVLDLAA